MGSSINRKMSTLPVLVITLLIASVATADLIYDYYEDTCEDFEYIVTEKMREWKSKDPSILPSILRLHFHDCAANGCDASILLDHPGSEKTSYASKTLRGFEVIEEIKAAVEAKCPKTVSCADILTAAARDATVLLKGPYWANHYGRKDGLKSLASEADKLPKGHENVTYLIEYYQSMGLDTMDLVVLSGAHSIGRTTCGAIKGWIFGEEYEKTRHTHSKYLEYLRRKCEHDDSVYVYLDPTTSNVVDNVFYKNLEKKLGTLYTDQVLEVDPRTRRLVQTLAAQPDTFDYLFSDSMVKLGDIINEDEVGEIRLKCSCVNGDEYHH